MEVVRAQACGRGDIVEIRLQLEVLLEIANGDLDAFVVSRSRR
jgi:hypothetical protein